MPNGKNANTGGGAGGGRRLAILVGGGIQQRLETACGHLRDGASPCCSTMLASELFSQTQGDLI